MMARSIQNVVEVTKSPEQVYSEKMAEIDSALVEHKDAVLEFIRLIDNLHRAQLLNMANAALEQGSSILEIVVDQAAHPQYAGGIKNVIGLMQLLSTMDVSFLNRTMDAISRALQRAENGRATNVGGVFQLMGLLQDQDVVTGLSFMVDVLKSIGNELRSGDGTVSSSAER